MALSLANVSIRIHNRQLFKDFNLEIKPGHISTLMGPSGSGKSTLFNFILGTLPTDFICSGEIHLNGIHLNPLPVEKRRIGILFQDPLLFPHLNVEENLAFGIRSHESRKEKSKKIQEVLAQAQLGKGEGSAGRGGIEKQYPDTLSGGEKTRIGLLRTLLSEPQAILLDEPFSKLDQTLREGFRNWVFDILKERNLPVMIVTHDPQDIPHQDTSRNSGYPEEYSHVIELSHV